MNINRREWLAACGVSTLSGAPPRRPNIVFILSDDHHYQCLGAAGNPNIRTPNLDRMAAEGTLFTNATISTPQCAPSRGVLLSGMESFQNGLRSNGARSFRDGTGPTVVEQMRRSGYQTALAGKWHILNTPRDCGFTSAPLWLSEGGIRYQNPIMRRGLDAPNQEQPGHITELLTQAAVDFIQGANSPSFLWLAYNAPHTPWYAPERYREIYAGKNARDLAPPNHPKNGADFDWLTYYAVISHLDDGIGRVLSAVEKKNARNGTVVFFLGDNGYLCGTKGLNGKVHPWEESVRVPLIVAGGPVRKGLRIDDPVASVDLPSTWLEVAGLERPSSLAGRRLLTALTTGKNPPTEAFAAWDDPRPEALVARRAIEPYRLIRTRRHKLIVWQSGKQALYDFEADPGEERDLMEDPRSRTVRDDLQRRLAARMAATGDRARGWLQN